MFHARTLLLLVAVFLFMASPPQLSASEQIGQPGPPAAAVTAVPAEAGKPSVDKSAAHPSPSSMTVMPSSQPSIAAKITTIPSMADKVVIRKNERLLHLMKDDRVIKTYKIALGGNPKGHKVQQGDQKTPEGEYRIDWRNPYSKFYLSLHISYPNQKDVEAARKLGVAPGGAIMIHGLPNGLGWIKEMHRIVDWTHGCIAVTNEEIEEIWKCVPDGTPVRIEG